MKATRGPKRSEYVQAFRVADAFTRSSDGHQRIGWRSIRGLIAEARVVQITPEQAAAVPPLADNVDREAKLLASVRLPFRSTFLAIGAGWADVRSWSETPLYAALLAEDADGVIGCTPFWLRRGRVFSYGAACTTESGDVAVHSSCVTPREAFNDPVPADTSRTLGGEVLRAVRGGIVQALRAVYLLESANIDIVESAGPSRGHQAHGVPHYEVVIRQNPRRYVGTDSDGQPRDWSHRWEVRGHFKHFGEDTPIGRANPDRVVDVPGRGRCVRIWCPPYVKGPEDKPLIPKRRVLIA